MTSAFELVCDNQRQRFNDQPLDLFMSCEGARTACGLCESLNNYCANQKKLAG